MVRISEAQAKRMGLKLPAAPKTGPAKPKAKGRNRAVRIVYDVESVCFTVSLPSDPKPKERPRTVVNIGALKGAYLASRGKLDVFMGMVSRSGGDDSQKMRISKTYTPQNTIDYEDLIKTAARTAMGNKPPFSCPVETTIIFVLVGDEKVWPTSRLDGDSDNLEKAVLDGLNGIVFDDDSLVVRSYREKTCGESSEVRIKVAPASPVTCQNQFGLSAS